MGDGIQYEDLIRFVIKVARDKIPKEEQKYINSTRLNKMVILVFNELCKNNIKTERFIWGYYRHGFYSRSVSNFLKYNYKDGFNLEAAHVNEVNLSANVKKIVSSAVSNLKDNFIKDRESFTKWVYGDIAPKEYRDFYFSHKKLEKWFETMNTELNNDIMHIDINDGKNILSDIISDYYFSLGHINDLEIISIFRRFTDILELLNLKLKGGSNPSQIKVLLDRLNSLYLNRIYSLLPPYIETIDGDPNFVKKEKEAHLLRIKSYKNSINKELDKIHSIILQYNLMPSFEEINDELSQMQIKLPDSNKSLRELYQDIE
ncbi:MAG: hypothetical protein ACP5C3_07330 [Methanomicrobiales archaeon]